MSFSTTISRGGAQIMAANRAIVRHTARNLIHAINDEASLKVRRKTAGWVDDYLFNTSIRAGHALQAIPLAIPDLRDISDSLVVRAELDHL